MSVDQKVQGSSTIMSKHFVVVVYCKNVNFL